MKDKIKNEKFIRFEKEILRETSGNNKVKNYDLGCKHDFGCCNDEGCCKDIGCCGE